MSIGTEVANVIASYRDGEMRDAGKSAAEIVHKVSQLEAELAALKAENERLRELLKRTDTALIEANGRQEQEQG